MVFPKVRMVVAGILFVSWIGFLAYLASQTRSPIVLSRPQFLVADAVALVKIQDDDKRTHEIVRFLRAAGDAGQNTIAHLDLIGADQGWRGPGEYIVPLTKTKEGYAVTTLPPVPGYVPLAYSVRLLALGKDTEVLRELSKFSEKSADEIGREISRLPLVWRLPRGRDEKNQPLPSYNATYAFVSRLKSLGADVELIGEPRIYLATADALSDLEHAPAGK
jgi:hypothetical protein